MMVRLLFWGNISTPLKENIGKQVLFWILQGFGSGSAWIRINLSCWIRIRIRIQIADPDPDPGGQKLPTKI
jgi:hypothetical protein